MSSIRRQDLGCPLQSSEQMLSSCRARDPHGLTSQLTP